MKGLYIYEHIYASVSEKFRKDKELALIAVTKCGFLIEHASKELRNDK